jgi:hypothetical protein
MKIELAGWHFRFDVALRKTVEVEGINSHIEGTDKHILLWDFDEASLEEIKAILLKIQKDFNLSTIYIIESSPTHYHAYCFKSCDLPNTLYILSSTPLIDEMFFKLGVLRGYWTLRITPKNKKQKFRLVCILGTTVCYYVSPEEIAFVKKLNVVKYTTGI